MFTVCIVSTELRQERKERRPDGKQLVQEVGCGGQEGPPGDVEGLLPPGIRAQSRHNATVVLQREGDDISIQGLRLLGHTQPQGEAVIPPEIHHARPGRGEASSPVHPLSVGHNQPSSSAPRSLLGFMYKPLRSKA